MGLTVGGSWHLCCFKYYRWEALREVSTTLIIASVSQFFKIIIYNFLITFTAVVKTQNEKCVTGDSSWIVNIKRQCSGISNSNIVTVTFNSKFLKKGISEHSCTYHVQFSKKKNSHSSNKNWKFTGKDREWVNCARLWRFMLHSAILHHTSFLQFFCIKNGGMLYTIIQ